MVCFPCRHIPLQGCKILSDFEGLLQKPRIFATSLINVFGKHSEISITQKQNTQKIRPPYPKQGKGTANQCQNHDKLIQFIISVSSNHKSVHLFSHGNLLQNNSFSFLLLLSYHKINKARLKESKKSINNFHYVLTTFFFPKLP